MTELLIIKPSSLGDIVHGLQVAASLKAQVKDLRISWVVREIFAPIVRACTAVDEVHIFERGGGAKGFLRLTRGVPHALPEGDALPPSVRRVHATLAFQLREALARQHGERIARLTRLLFESQTAQPNDIV